MRISYYFKIWCADYLENFFALLSKEICERSSMIEIEKSKEYILLSRSKKNVIIFHRSYIKSFQSETKRNDKMPMYISYWSWFLSRCFQIYMFFSIVIIENYRFFADM